MSENESPRPSVSIDATDIQSSDVPRRSFLRGFGILAGTTALTGMAACEIPTVSDSCDADVSDTDPHDPIGQGGDACDSD